MATCRITHQDDAFRRYIQGMHQMVIRRHGFEDLKRKRTVLVLVARVDERILDGYGIP